jgi:transposase
MTPSPDGKREALRRQGVLYARPHDVTDPLFRGHAFFDPCDLIQVKYEMLRRVEVEGYTVATAAVAFGLSRTAFYQAQAAYQRHGLPGLIPQRPGPRHAHKISDKVMEFLLRQQALDPTLRPSSLAVRLGEVLGLSVHPRSIGRALARQRKKGLRVWLWRPAAWASRGRRGTRGCASTSWRPERAQPAAVGNAPW